MNIWNKSILLTFVLSFYICQAQFFLPEIEAFFLPVTQLYSFKQMDD